MRYRGMLIAAAAATALSVAPAIALDPATTVIRRVPLDLAGPLVTSPPCVQAMAITARLKAQIDRSKRAIALGLAPRGALVRVRAMTRARVVWSERALVRCTPAPPVPTPLAPTPLWPAPVAPAPAPAAPVVVPPVVPVPGVVPICRGLVPPPGMPPVMRPDVACT